ncbi:unnamed protein product, partial [marine sediment metagenome]
AGYEWTDIDYDKEDQSTSPISDSEEQRYYVGLDWEITAKSRGRVKLGRNTKEFDDSVLGKDREYLVELQLSHQLTPKTTVDVNGFRRPVETSISETAYSLIYQLKAVLTHQFTHKISGGLDCGYKYEKFKGDLTYGGETKERRDDLFSVTPSLSYQIKRWLSTRLDYIYEKRDSNFSDFSYSTHTVSVMLKAAF